ncbi:hypothetical protein [Nocardia abscessus]|uniref:hypothetical protein n=1 Tax=Nocardia abscessus TaxID=120957 RepID=UPI0014614B8D|nr:hypothetical protein [Nocardia abscessus]
MRKRVGSAPVCPRRHECITLISRIGRGIFYVSSSPYRQDNPKGVHLWELY